MRYFFVETIFKLHMENKFIIICTENRIIFLKQLQKHNCLKKQQLSMKSAKPVVNSSHGSVRIEKIDIVF